MSIEIELHGPRISSALHGGDQGLSLDHLASDTGHVHGELRVTVSGCRLPRMGFFGPGDVCVGTWLMELNHAAKTLRASDPARYLFDEGEQGQPAFLFEREGDVVILSVVDAEFSDGVGSPEWGRQACKLSEFTGEVARFTLSLEESFEREAPGQGRAWVRRAARSAG